MQRTRVLYRVSFHLVKDWSPSLDSLLGQGVAVMRVLEVWLLYTFHGEFSVLGWCVFGCVMYVVSL